MSEPPGRVVKAVLDASVVLRGISSASGPSGRIVDAFLNSAFDLVLSLEIVAEVQEAIRRSRIPAIPPIDDRLRGEIMTALVGAAEIATGTYRVELVPTDPKDDHVVSAAIESGAEYIVSEDKRDLLVLKVVSISGYSPVQVVNARDFLTHVLGLDAPAP